MKRTLFAMVAAVAVLVLPVPQAFAHDEVVTTSPLNGDRLDKAPEVVDIELTAAPRPDSVTASIVDTEGTHWESEPVRVAGTHVLIPLRLGAGSGDYTVEFAVIGADGHQVRRTIGFRIEVPEAASPTTATVPGSTTDSPPPDGGRTWQLAAMAAGLATVVVVMVVGLRLRRG